MLGQCQLEQGNLKDALGYFLKGLKVETTKATQAVALRYEIGKTYLSQGMHEDALKYLEEGTRIDPNFRDISTLLEITRNPKPPKSPSSKKNGLKRFLLASKPNEGKTPYL